MNDPSAQTSAASALARPLFGAAEQPSHRVPVAVESLRAGAPLHVESDAPRASPPQSSRGGAVDLARRGLRVFRTTTNTLVPVKRDWWEDA